MTLMLQIAEGNRSLLPDVLTSYDYNYEGVGNMDLDQRERTKLETQIRIIHNFVCVLMLW